VDSGSATQAWRAEIEAWLLDHPHPSPQELSESGYVAPHWPRPYGIDAGPLQQIVIDEVLREKGVARPVNPIGIGWAGPTLLHSGTEQQKARFLPGILSGAEIWCQLFSEPGAGSDLAALETRAVRDGDEYIVTGQKVWTSLAHVARFGILLARTTPRRPAHQGISYLICPMDSPGIDVRPLVDMTGGHTFNQVYLDHVRLPLENRVGQEGDGWRLAKVTLSNERFSLSSEGALWGSGPSAADLLDLVRSHGHPDDIARQALAALYAESEALRLIRLRTLGALVQGREPGPEASVRKALADEHGQHIMCLAKDLAGAGGMTNLGPLGASAEPWSSGFLFSPALTIGGGTAEVQRNIIGERILGLPRDPSAQGRDASSTAR
jgi:alkylation response protein AidB-like acyl-CoA dehydrogenase